MVQKGEQKTTRVLPQTKGNMKQFLLNISKIISFFEKFHTVFFVLFAEYIHTHGNTLKLAVQTANMMH